LTTDAITYLRTETIALDALTPFPGNARRGDVDKIRESLRANGQYRSLIVRQTDDDRLIVLTGNHTRQALMDEGYAGGRCEVIRCDDATATRINLVDNRLPDFGTYDNEALLEALSSLGDDLEGTGYDFGFLDDLLAATDVPQELEEGPSGARYAESEEEMEARRERIESYEPRHGEPSEAPAATTELILVVTIAQREEISGLVRRIRERDGSEKLAAQIILDALRVHAGDSVTVTPPEEEADAA
jgi:ParB-like chromosome segregation protein Spo0J